MLISARDEPRHAWQTRMPDEEVQLANGRGWPIQIRRGDTGGFVIHQPGQVLRIKVVDAHTIELLPVDRE
jgi:hypothetical protein